MNEDKKPDYFNMSDAVDEFRHGSFGAKEKTLSGLKMFGKGLFNVTKYTVTNLPAAVERAAKKSAEKK